MARLRVSAWPGNVRELENACERLAILAPGSAVRLEDLPGVARSMSPTARHWLDALPESISLVDVEREVIVHALGASGGNLSAAARRLGVPRHILVYRVEKYGIER